MGIKIRGLSDTQNLENSLEFYFADGLLSDCLKILRISCSESLFPIKRRSTKTYRIHDTWIEKRLSAHTLRSLGAKCVGSKMPRRFQNFSAVISATR